MSTPSNNSEDSLQVGQQGVVSHCLSFISVKLKVSLTKTLAAFHLVEALVISQ